MLKYNNRTSFMEAEMRSLSKFLLAVGSFCLISTAPFAANISKVGAPAPCMCIKAPCNCPETKPTQKPGIKPNQPALGNQTLIAVPTPLKPATPSVAPKPSGWSNGGIPK